MKWMRLITNINTTAGAPHVHMFSISGISLVGLVFDHHRAPHATCVLPRYLVFIALHCLRRLTNVGKGQRVENGHDPQITDYWKTIGLWFFVSNLDTPSKVPIWSPVWNRRELKARSSLNVYWSFTRHPKNLIFNGCELWLINWHAPSTCICEFRHKFSEQLVLYWMRYRSLKFGPKKQLHKSRGHTHVKKTVSGWRLNPSSSWALAMYQVQIFKWLSLASKGPVPPKFKLVSHHPQ